MPQKYDVDLAEVISKIFTVISRHIYLDENKCEIILKHQRMTYPVLGW